jgi:hypothetical protein
MVRLIAAVAVFTLSSGAAAAQTRKDTDKVSDAAKPICKRFLETGSLVKGYRVCKTKAEWDRERDNIRNNANTSSACSSGESGRC